MLNDKMALFISKDLILKDYKKFNLYCEYLIFLLIMIYLFPFNFIGNFEYFERKDFENMNNNFFTFNLHLQ